MMPVNVKTEKRIALPKGVQASLKEKTLEVKGPKGTLSRTFAHPKIRVEVGKEDIAVISDLPKKKEYALTGTWAAHVNNMVKGVVDGFEYKMKIVYSHFPIKTSVKESKLMIENFLGERHPREAVILPDVDVNVSGDAVTITGIDIEHVGQTAANIEKATYIKNYDPRIFQDGIYIVEKRK
jgi:large subunit ribosomal protein L6